MLHLHRFLSSSSFFPCFLPSLHVLHHLQLTLNNGLLRKRLAKELCFAKVFFIVYVIFSSRTHSIAKRGSPSHRIVKFFAYLVGNSTSCPSSPIQSQSPNLSKRRSFCNSRLVSRCNSYYCWSQEWSSPSFIRFNSASPNPYLSNLKSSIPSSTIFTSTTLSNPPFISPSSSRSTIPNSNNPNPSRCPHCNINFCSILSIMV